MKHPIPASTLPAIPPASCRAAAIIALAAVLLSPATLWASPRSVFQLIGRHHNPPPAAAPSTHFKLAYEPGLEGSVEQVQNWLEGARQRGDETLDYLPIFPVGVTLCSTAQQYRRMGGRDVAAGAVIRSGLLILVDQRHPEDTATAIERVYLRYAIGQVTGRRAAPWLVEGIEQSHTVGFTAALPAIAAAAQTNHLLSLPSGVLAIPGPADPLAEHPSASPAISGKSAPLPLATAEAVFAVWYLEQVGGAKALSKLLQDIGDGKGWSEALQDVAQLNGSAFEEGWLQLARTGVRAFVPPGDHTGSWSSGKMQTPPIPTPPLVGRPARIRIVIGTYDLRPTDSVDALLVAGGNVTIRGTVTAHIGVIGGNVRLASSALVRGHISILGGSLTVDQGAIVQATAEVSSTDWNPASIQSSRANLDVTLDHPAEVDLRLPGQSYWLKEGSITIAPGETLDAALALGGSVTVSGTVNGRVVAIGGDVKLPAPPPTGLGITTLGGRLVVAGKPLPPDTEPDSITQIISFVQDFAAPVQPGPDPVPVYLGVGDCAIPRDASYDAILCVGGSVLIGGTVHGGLVAGGDAMGVSGSTLSGPIWGFGGHVRSQPGADIKHLQVLGEAAQPEPPGTPR